MSKTEPAEKVLLKEVPGQMKDSEIFEYLYTKDIDWRYVNTIRFVTDFTDEIVSEWLNLSVRTLREYRKPKSKFKDNVKEHVLLLLTLIKHGLSVFGTQQGFDGWLGAPNFYFNNRTPSDFLNTVTGIRFVNDRLTAMEFGDNV